MRRLVPLFLLSLLPVPLLAQSAGATKMSADEREIRRLDSLWVVAVAAKDTGFIRTIQADSAVALPPNAPMVQGKQAVLAMWATLVETPGVQLAFAPTAIHLARSGDQAYGTGTYTYAQDNPQAGGPRLEDHGKYVEVWRKIGGKWQVMADIWNSDVPMASTPR